MLRTLFMIGLMAIVGLFALKIVFGVLAGLFGVFAIVVILAIKILFWGALVYFILRIVSPSTARSLEDRFSGSTQA